MREIDLTKITMVLDDSTIHPARALAYTMIDIARSLRLIAKALTEE